MGSCFMLIPNAKSIALSAPTRPKDAWWNIGFTGTSIQILILTQH